MFPRQSAERVGHVGKLTLLVGLALGACQDHIVVGHTGRAPQQPGGAGSPDPGLSPAEPGLLGEYWDNLDLSGDPTFTRIESSPEFVWSDSPAPGVSNMFSARWQAVLRSPTQGTYQLSLESDDGSRLWLDGELLIDQWKGAPNLTEQEVPLDPSQPRALRLELFSLGGSASLRLQWQGPSVPLQPVTAQHLSVP